MKSLSRLYSPDLATGPHRMCVWPQSWFTLGEDRCRIRVIDTFGTEPAYNHEEYATLHGYRTNWGYWNLNPKQFMTMFRECYWERGGTLVCAEAGLPICAGVGLPMCSRVGLPLYAGESLPICAGVAPPYVQG